MRKKVQLGAIVVAALVSSGSAVVLARGEGDAKAASVMAKARKALGGEKKLAALQGLSLRAEFRRELTNGAQGGGGGTVVMMGGAAGFGGGSQAAGSLEMDVLFPDKFYRQETTTSGFGLTRVDGFEGDRPFLDVSSNNPGMRVMADRPGDDPARAKAALKRTNADLARLLLGLVAGTQPGVPVAYAYAGQAESPDGTAHVIDVTGSDDFKARLFIDSATHLPLMLTYLELEPRPARMVTSHGGPASGGIPRVTTGAGGSAPGATRMDLTPEQRAELDKQMKEAPEAPRKIVELRMFFSDYREVDGISLPHRIARGTAEKTTEEWDIKGYKVNPNIKADRFKVGTE